MKYFCRRPFSWGRMYPAHFIYACILLLSFWAAETTATPVVVSGRGVTHEAALQEAFKEAVRQGVGSYIESSTMVRNDKLINETILEVAYGYVDKYTVISEQKTDGQYHIKIEAEVSAQAVSAVLANILPAQTLSEKERKNLNIQLDNEISNQVDYHLRKKRSEENRKKTEEICRNIFLKYHAALKLTYEFVPRDIIIQSSDNKYVTIKVTGIVRTNKELYNLILNSLLRKYEKILRREIHPFPMNESDFYREPARTRADSIFGIGYNSVALEQSPELESTEYVLNILGVRRPKTLGKMFYALDDLNSFLNRSALDGLRKKTRARDETDGSLLFIYFIDEKGDLLYPLTRLEIFTEKFMYHEIITPYFKIEEKEGASYDYDFAVINYDFAVIKKIPISIARKIAGVRGFLCGNEEGERLLEQLLKGF